MPARCGSPALARSGCRWPRWSALRCWSLFRPAAARLHRLGRDPDRMGDGVGAGLPAARRRTAGQHGAAGGAARAAVRRAGGGAGLADRAQRLLPAARFWAWLAVAPLAVPAFVHSYAWITSVPGLHGLSGGVLVSVLAYFPFLYLPVAARCAGSIRRWRMPPPRSAVALAGVLPGGAAAIAAGAVRRLAAGRPASAGRIRPVRDDPLRYLHHGDRRPVPVELITARPPTCWASNTKPSRYT